MGIIDRRFSSKKGSSGNRDRFLKRVNNKIKDSIKDAVAKQSIKDISSSDGNIKIPIRDIREPKFTHNHNTGTRERVLPQNDQFNEGDKIRKPKGQSGNSGKGNQPGDGENYDDDFYVIVSKEEFLQYFFDDLELPNMIKKSLSKVKSKKQTKHGFTVDGPPNRLNISRSYKKSLSRRIGIESYIKRRIKELENKLNDVSEDEKESILKEIENLKKNLKTIIFMDDVDLIYNNYDIKSIPTTQAVMFCVMDVSGSMTENHKDIAKRFFMLLYLFLQRNYDQVDLVFIRHTTEAKEVDEKEFFESRESGGTRVHPSLELVGKIIKERYNNEWNAYCCQASDGDVFWDDEDSDAYKSRKELENNLLNKLQYMAYIDIKIPSMFSSNKEVSDLLIEYEKIKRDNFVCRVIDDVTNIWPVFKNLFAKQ